MKLRSLFCSVLLATSSISCVHANRASVETSPEASSKKPEAKHFIERARKYASVGDGTRAEQYLNAALATGGSEREITPLLLEVCIRDSRYRSAASYAENYLRKHPDDHRMRFVLATLYSGLEDIERARKQFEFLLRARPEHAEAHYAFAILLRDNLGDHANADYHFREYLRVAPKGSHSEEANASLLSRLP